MAMLSRTKVLQGHKRRRSESSEQSSMLQTDRSTRSKIRADAHSSGHFGLLDRWNIGGIG